ncbi:MAG: hypothetical protein R2823_00660 [Acidimicrobiia bacterium]
MLRFRLFGIPIEIHISFLIIAVLGPRSSVAAVSLWVGAVFIAILLHELGHGLTAKAFGARKVSITLYGLGGLTSFTEGEQPMSHGRSFTISAMGSGVGIVAGLAIIGLGRLGMFDRWPDASIDFLGYFVFAALVWGILNWIPIMPLDGGHMVLHLIAVFDERRAPLIAQIVTWTAVAIAVPVAIVNGFVFAAIIVVVFAFMGLGDFLRTNHEPRARDTAGGEPPGVSPPQEPPKDPPTFPI